MKPVLDTRLAALRRFAIAITVLNIAGHTVLGFEQSYAQPIFSLLTAYSIELFLEYIQSVAHGRRPRFLQGGLVGFVDFMLPAHITGLAVAMLLYANSRIIPVIFASGIAVCSKAIFTIKQPYGSRHFFNPSNFGITVTLLFLPSVGITPPYMFTEGLGPVGSVLLPAFIVMTGTLLNFKLTHRIPLLLSWAGAFILQDVIRHFLFGAAFLPVLGVMTGVTFLLYTFYMITDPATTPVSAKGQVFFGVSVGLLYGALVIAHIVFGMFFALTFVCLCRGIVLALEPAPAPVKVPAQRKEPALAAIQ